MAVPYTFGSATSSIPLSQLDSNFATAITLGNTAVYLGNTTTTLNGLTLSNVTISSGNVTITSVTLANANITGTTTLSGLTASTALALDASKNIVSVTNTGTGNNVLAASPSLTGTVTIATLNLTNALGTTYGGTGLTSFTSGGVVYASSSSALATGSALTFDGTTLNTSGLTVATNRAQFKGNTTTSFTGGSVEIGYTGTVGLINSYDRTASAYKNLEIYGNDIYNYVKGSNAIWDIAGTGETMRLTSTGLGIGTSSPTQKLDVVLSSATAYSSGVTGNGLRLYNSSTTTGQYVGITFSGEPTAGNAGLATIMATTTGSGNMDLTFSTRGSSTLAERARIDSSGNLLLGSASSPATIWSGSRTFYYAKGNTAGNGGEVIVESYNGNQQASFFASAITAEFGLWSTKASAILFGNNNAERARITSAGDFVVGATSANLSSASRGVIEVNGTSTAYIGLDTGNTTRGTLYTNGSMVGLASLATIPLTFGTTAGTEYGRFDTSGNLLVNQTSATASTKFSLTTAANGIAINMPVSGTGIITIPSTNATYEAAAFFNGVSTKVGSISVTTAATLFNTTSDQRLKENIQDSEEASSLIDSLQVRKFNWKNDNSHQRYGFIAQELLTVAPEAVHQPEDTEQMMAVDYSKLVPMLVKEIQSLRKRLADAGIA